MQIHGVLKPDSIKRISAACSFRFHHAVNKSELCVHTKNCNPS